MTTIEIVLINIRDVCGSPLNAWRDRRCKRSQKQLQQRLQQRSYSVLTVSIYRMVVRVRARSAYVLRTPVYVRSIANAGYHPRCPLCRVYSYGCRRRRFLSFLAPRWRDLAATRADRHASSMPLRSQLNDTPCPLWARLPRHLPPRTDAPRYTHPRSYRYLNSVLPHAAWYSSERIDAWIKHRVSSTTCTAVQLTVRYAGLGTANLRRVRDYVL